MEGSFLFQRYKNYKNRPRNARVVVENNVASFFSGHGVLHLVFMYPGENERMLLSDVRPTTSQY